MLPLLPEIIVIGAAVLVLILEIVLGNERAKKMLAPLVLVALIGAAAVASVLMPDTYSLFGGRFVVDSVAWWFKLLFILSAGGIVLLSFDLLDGSASHKESHLGHGAEYLIILLFNLAGMMALISSRDLITLYVSLELATVPLFILAAWSRTSISSEAGIKYVILGALASALLLYGLGLLYGLSGSTDLAVISDHLVTTPTFLLAASLLFAGLGFKLALVPFHVWAPDVYQGAPTPVTAYLSVASKGAGLALAFIVLFKLMGAFLPAWDTAIALLAACTMTLGNVVAISQTNIKRFMAYSSISQAGYLLLGFLGPVPEGVPAMLFYLLAYVVTNIAVFSVIIYFSNSNGREEIKDYAGLSLRHPLLALGMMVALFSLAGIPPLSGFTGKFFLFSIASKHGMHWLVALAALNSTVSLYYYLKIVRQMYIEPSPEWAKPLAPSRILSFTLCLALLATIALGILPQAYERIHRETIGYIQ